MTCTDLKINPIYFNDVYKGVKRSEIRFNDRSYKSGDIYRLCEYDGECFTGRFVYILITHVLYHFKGLVPGWCMFSFIVLTSYESNIK